MKRFALLAAPARFAAPTAVLGAALWVAGCVSAPKPPTTAELLLGSWKCQTALKDGQAEIDSAITYAAGGKSDFHVTVKAQMGAMSMDLMGQGSGSWQLLEGDQLESKIADMKVTSAHMNGNTVDTAMIQGMANQMLAGQSATAPITVSKTAMTQTTPDGVVTSCTRAAA